MTSVQITNGVIKYGRTIKTGDYENKRGDVELSFIVPEGEGVDAHISRVGEMAALHCQHMLAHDGAPSPKAETKVKEPIAKKSPKLPKAHEPEEELDPLADRAIPPTPKFIEKEIAAQNKKSAESVDEESLGDLMGEGEPAKEITDKELTDATQKCQSRAKNAPAIRKALNELGVKTPPGRIIDLPQEKRQTYLEKLEAIKPLA